MDVYDSKAPIGNYTTIKVGGADYVVPWKSVETGSLDRILAGVSGGVADSIHFITTNGNMVMTAPGKTKDTAQVLITGINPTDDLKAWYTDYVKKDSVTVQNRVLAGQAEVVAYDKITSNVVLVEVNGAPAPDAPAIQNMLNTIYAPALAQWNVTKISNFNPTLTSLQNGQFDSNHKDSVGFNTNEAELIDTFVSQNNFDPKTLYLFFIKNPTSNNTKHGYMALNQNFGFIFRDNQTIEEIDRTIAHELGHGAYSLHHVFSEKCTYPQTKGQTNNLMDYVSASQAITARQLYKYQWDAIQAAFNDSILGSSVEGGSEAENSNNTLIINFLNSIKNKNLTHDQSLQVTSLPKAGTYLNVQLGVSCKLKYIVLTNKVVNSFSIKPSELDIFSKSGFLYTFHTLNESQLTSNNAFHLFIDANDQYAFEQYLYNFNADFTPVSQFNESIISNECHFCNTWPQPCCSDFNVASYSYSYPELKDNKPVLDANNNPIFLQIIGTCQTTDYLNSNNSTNFPELTFGQELIAYKDIKTDANTRSKYGPDLKSYANDILTGGNDCCYSTCKYILKQRNITVLGRDKRIDLATLKIVNNVYVTIPDPNDADNTINALDYNSSGLISGVTYLNKCLANNIPVVIGVNKGGIGPNANHATQHFVVIYQRISQDNKTIQYKFYDVGTSNTSNGQSPLNILTLFSDHISGQNYDGTSYTITEIRKNLNLP